MPKRIVPMIAPQNGSGTIEPNWIYEARDLCVVVMEDAVKMQTSFEWLIGGAYHFSAGGAIDALNSNAGQPSGDTFLLNISPVMPWGQATVTLKTRIEYYDGFQDPPEQEVTQTHSEVPTLPALTGRQHALVIFAAEDQADAFVIDPEEDWGGHHVLMYNNDPVNTVTANYGAGDVEIQPRAIGYVPVDPANALYAFIPSPRPLFIPAIGDGEIAYPKPI